MIKESDERNKLREAIKEEVRLKIESKKKMELENYLRNKLGERVLRGQGLMEEEESEDQ